MTDNQLWVAYVKCTGRAAWDAKAAKEAFIEGLRIGRGDAREPDFVAMNGVSARIGKEMDFLRNDSVTLDILSRSLNGDAERAGRLIADFETLMRSTGKTHYSLMDTRKHFFNWFMKRREYGSVNERAKDNWREDIVSRIRRLAFGSNGNGAGDTARLCQAGPGGLPTGGVQVSGQVQVVRGIPGETGA